MAPAVADPVSITGIFMQVIPLTQLKPSPLNPRKHFDQAALEDLARTMGNGVGVIEPLVARLVNGALFEIVAGERRWRAAKIAQLEAVPVVVKELTDIQVLELMVIENDAREDLNPLEEADGFKRLIKFGFDIDKLAARIGHTRKYVYDRMKLLELIPAAQELLIEGRITAAHGIHLARLTPAQQKETIDPGNEGLFDWEDVEGLFKPGEEPTSTKADPYARHRTRSVRELEAWINSTFRLDLKGPQLQEYFPETAEAIETAEKVVHLTFDSYLYHQSDKKDGEHIHLATEWKRADGTKGAKACDQAVTGVIVVGAGRGEAFKVCVAKGCKIHFPAPKPVASSTSNARAAKPSANKWHEQQMRRQRKESDERKRFSAAMPAISQAIAERIPELKLQTLVDLVAGRFTTAGLKKAQGSLPKVSNAESALRVLALAAIHTRLANDWVAPQEVPKVAKAIGLNLAPLLKPKKAVTASAQKSTGRGKKAKKR